MTPSTDLKQLTSADGLKLNGIAAERYTIGPKQNSKLTSTVERVSYTCKRPNGRRHYLVVGYENGTFSTAA